MKVAQNAKKKKKKKNGPKVWKEIFMANLTWPTSKKKF